MLPLPILITPIPTEFVLLGSGRRGVTLWFLLHVSYTVECILCSENVYTCSTLPEAMSGQVICKTYSHPAVLDKLFTRQLLTAEECSEVARKGEWEWEDHLTPVLSTKPADVVQEACQVLEKHGCPVKNLKSELYYSSTLCQVVFQVLHYTNLIVAHTPTV